MAELPQTQGPGKGVLDTVHRIATIVVGIVETRVRLAAIELEEEKATLIQLLMMAGITLLFTAFGLMSLLVLVIWAIDPAYRLVALGSTTAVLLALAIIGVIWTLTKARRSTLLGSTRKQLETDRELLEKER
ncbi:TPA: phage holin family protein [Yersinia enterocolitica]|uniref:phage holin family protein n=1 Tax=Yersinia enterocolitica TaxID=630 RepID=UPI0005DB808D|nr:phage holin family protein [Yersinia enterocolitica]CNF47480.1 inner membrane protein YqjE [Yersinia enterocolitica]CRY04693.1 inner membrane protein YqjE [Yersinia enterocolitica]HDL7690524.1 phage holin family protein [Yersinia enterocolitica]HDL7794218.1 phage holin family protein [Yersinia enterocolitica]HDL7815172.1 phage holin family protein [Yersinia enterocolitica]